jgi:hypothetical protein
MVLNLFVKPLAKLQDDVCTLEIGSSLYYLAKIIDVLVDTLSTLEEFCGLEVGP